VPRPRRRIYAAIVTEPGGILLAHTKMDANFKKNKQTNRQIDIQTDRQTNRQTKILLIIS
jgi:hypothetical protein